MVEYRLRDGIRLPPVMVANVPLHLKLPVVVLAALLCACGCGKGDAVGNVDAQLAEGWRAYSTGDFDYAVSVFEDVDSAARLSPEQAYSALLGLATTQHFRSVPKLPAAREHYVRLGELGTDLSRRESLLGLARVDMAEGETLEAQRKLGIILRDFPESLEADEAAIQLAEFLLRPEIIDKEPGRFELPSPALVQRAIATLQDRIRQRPDSRLLPAMHMMLANIYVQQRKFAEAVEHLVSAEEAGIAIIKTRAIVLWSIAQLAERELRDYELAERYYSAYVEEFSRSTLYYRAAEGLERVRDLKAEGDA